MTPSISVIIPTLNESLHLEETIRAIGSDALEILVADGGSGDETAQLARHLGATVITGAQGRAAQMNAAAASARGDVLLFLHADTLLPPRYASAIAEILACPGTSAGAFRLGIRGVGVGLRLIEAGANLRSRILSMPYGDQAIFLPRELFSRIGGFAEIPIMEDFEMVQRLRKSGRIRIAPERVTTSDRRWKTLGVFRTTAWNWTIVLAWKLGVSPFRLADWYRGRATRSHRG